MGLSSEGKGGKGSDTTGKEMLFCSILKAEMPLDSTSGASVLKGIPEIK